MGKNDYWGTLCRQCGATVPGDTDVEARAKWNRRVPLSARLAEQPALVDEVLRQLNQYCCEEFDEDYGLPIGAEENVRGLRALVLTWVQLVEGSAQDSPNSAPVPAGTTQTPEKKL
jgi:hypothetical protein